MGKQRTKESKEKLFDVVREGMGTLATGLTYDQAKNHVKELALAYPENTYGVLPIRTRPEKE